MTDLRLQELLLGRKRSESLRSPVRETLLTKSLDEQINFLVEEVMEGDDPSAHPFSTPVQRRAQLREELTQELQFPELASYIFPAFKTLLNEKHAYLEVAANKQMQNCFAQAASVLSQLDPDKLDAAELSELLNISDSATESILKVARVKFDDGLYPDCMSIFVLLVTLSPSNWDFWFRLGIAAQEGDNFNLALRAYDAAIALNPEHLDSYLFAAECLRKQGEVEHAKEMLAAAEGLVANADVESRQLFLVFKKSM